MRADTATTPTTPDITRSLRAMRAAARPCGTSEDGRTVLAIHLDERRADDLLAAADEIDRITEAGRAHIRRAAQFEAERDALRAELARWNAELSAVMPADFKDWTSTSERPQLAAWVIKNLRERLAEPTIKPHAWACVWPEDAGGGGFTTLDEQTALNYMAGAIGAADLHGCRPTLVPLYAAPQPPAQAERLTDGQIVGLAIGAGVDSDDEDDDGTTVFAIARAVESACATAWGVKLEGDAV